jgi:hypothetical protein
LTQAAWKRLQKMTIEFFLTKYGRVTGWMRMLTIYDCYTQYGTILYVIYCPGIFRFIVKQYMWYMMKFTFFVQVLSSGNKQTCHATQRHFEKPNRLLAFNFKEWFLYMLEQATYFYLNLSGNSKAMKLGHNTIIFSSISTGQQMHVSHHQVPFWKSNFSLCFSKQEMNSALCTIIRIFLTWFVSP